MSDKNSPKKFNPITRFLLSCGGTNLELMQKCRLETAKYVGMGGAVLFTAALAAFSGGYAMYSISQNSLTAILFGGFWGMVIFNMDRYAVASMKKDGLWYKQLLLAVPRLALAIAISLVISKPTEVFICRKEVGLQLKREKDDSLAVLKSRVGLELDSLGREVAHYDSLGKLHSSWAINPPKDIDLSISNEQNRLSDQQIMCQEARAGQSEIDLIDQKLIGLEADEDKFHEGNQGATFPRQAELNRLRSRKKDLLWQIRRACGALEQQRNNLANQLNERREEYRLIAKSNMETRDQIQALQLREKRRVDSILGNRAEIIDTYNQGIVAKIDALHNLGESRPLIGLISWAIMMLIILLDILPVLFKLIMKPGAYDKLLALWEAETENRDIIARNSNLKVHLDQYSGQVAVSGGFARQIIEQVDEWFKQEDRYLDISRSHSNLITYLEERVPEAMSFIVALPKPETSSARRRFNYQLPVLPRKASFISISILGILFISLLFLWQCTGAEGREVVVKQPKKVMAAPIKSTGVIDWLKFLDESAGSQSNRSVINTGTGFGVLLDPNHPKDLIQ